MNGSRGAIPMDGQRFGKLQVTERAGTSRHRMALWRCQCDCGQTTVVTGADLRQGHVRSCGCLHGERLTRHGHAVRGAEHPLYGVWANLIQRCENPKNRSYADYGGRGIAVSATWRRDFAAFLADMGERPGHAYSIDRIDNDGNYEPGNCRWATRSQQQQNRRRRAAVSKATGETLAGAVERAFALADERDTSHSLHELSISSLGRCLRESAYRVSGTPADEGLELRSGRAAHLGTWIHAGLLPLLAAVLPGRIRREHRVVLTYGPLRIKGRADLWWKAGRMVIDAKTTREYGLHWVRRDGPRLTAALQVAGYAMALEGQGETVEQIAFLYMDRATGQHEVMVEAFTDKHRRMVESRLQAIITAAELPELAEREEDGPGLSVVCDGCAWLRRCWGPDAIPGVVGPQTQLAALPEGVSVVLDLYGKGAALVAAGDRDKKFARAILEGAPPGVYGKWKLTWTGGKAPEEVPDGDAAVVMLAMMGYEAPTKKTHGTKPSINVKLAEASSKAVTHGVADVST